MLRRAAIHSALFPYLQTDTPDAALNPWDAAGESFVPENQDTAVMPNTSVPFASDETSEPPASEKYAPIGTANPSRAFINTNDAPESPSIQDGSGLSGADAKSTKRASWEDKHPAFQYPNAVPENGALTSQQSAENALAKARYQREHPENLDHGVKGVLKEVLSNFFEGLSHARPGMGLKESLLLGGVGAGAGAINRTWNEQRGLDQLIPQLEHNVDQETSTAVKNEQIATMRRDDQRGDQQLELNAANALTAQQKVQYQRLNDSQRQVLDVYKEAEEFDPTSEQGKVLSDRAKELGVTLLPKSKGEKFTFQVSPNGKLIVGNTRTGGFTEGEGNYATPKTVSSADILDLFPDVKAYKPEDPADYATKEQSRNKDVTKLRADAHAKQLEAGRYAEAADQAAKRRDPESEATYRNQATKAYSEVTSLRAQADGSQATPRSAKPAGYEEVRRLAAAVASQPTMKPNGVRFSQNELKDAFEKIQRITKPKERATRLQQFFKSIEDGFISVQ